MKRIALASILLVALGQTALAHPDDVIRPGKRAGPILLGATTFEEAKAWFGEPTRVGRGPYGCIKVIRATWAGRLRALFWRGDDHPAVVAKVRNRVIESSVHGALEMHTGKDLRVGDTEARLKDLYPDKDAETHDGHTHYVLVSGPNDGRLVARVEEGVVVEIETGPYEAC